MHNIIFLDILGIIGLNVRIVIHLYSNEGDILPKELINDLFVRHLYIWLFFLGLVHMALHFIGLKFVFQLLGTKIGLSRMWPGILALTLVTLLGKWVVPVEAYGLVLLGMTFVISKNISQAPWLKSLWSSILLIIISFIGGLVISEPLCSTSKEIAHFILRTAPGAAVGAFMEVLFPALALFILTTFHISLPLPSSKRITLTEFFSALAFVLLIFILYFSFAQTLADFKNTGKLTFTMYTAAQWSGAILVGILLYVIIALFRHERLERADEKADLLSQIGNVINAHMDMGYTIKRSEGGILIETYITSQELKIIALVVQEKSYQEIGDIMCLTEGTIRNNVSDILGKLGLSSKEQLIKYAIKKDILNKNDKAAS